MQLITRNVPANHDIYLLGDIHRGIIAHNKKEYEAVIEKIKLQDNAFAIIMGDLIEAKSTPLSQDLTKYSKMLFPHPPMPTTLIFGRFIISMILVNQLKREALVAIVEHQK